MVMGHSHSVGPSDEAGPSITLLTALPVVASSYNNTVYVIGLEDVYWREEAAEKRAKRGVQPAKKSLKEAEQGTRQIPNHDLP